MPDSQQNRLPSSHNTNLFRRDSGRGYQAPLDTNFIYGEGSYGQSSFSSEPIPCRQFQSRDEPLPKRHRRNPSYPEIDSRYVLGSHKGSGQVNGDDASTPYNSTGLFGDSYFSQYTTQNRTNESPSSRSVAGQARRQYTYADSNQYPTPDSSKGYQGHASNRLSTGSESAVGYGGSTDPGRHHYPSSAETQAPIPAPAAMHPPVLGTSRPSPPNEPRYWQGSLENATTYGAYHSRSSSGGALPTGHLLPAPMNLQSQSRSSVENTLPSI